MHGPMYVKIHWCNKFRLLIFLNQLHMFRATNSPIFRSTFDCIYSFWYNAPILLSTGDKAEMELHGVPSQLLVSPELCSMELFVFLRPPEFHIIPIAIFSKHWVVLTFSRYKPPLWNFLIILLQNFFVYFALWQKEIEHSVYFCLLHTIDVQPDSRNSIDPSTHFVLWQPETYIRSKTKLRFVEIDLKICVTSRNFLAHQTIP
jgi:hypothetical protein